jgi:thiol-disulfide isomerase/thioredoxin
MGSVLNLLIDYKRALSYTAYIDILGKNLSSHQLHYKKFVIDATTMKKISKFQAVKILVITEPWCSDSLALLPIIKKIAECNNRWDLKVLLRDKNAELMEKFLTDGARAIPVFLFINEKGELLFRWGPRPTTAVEIFSRHRSLIINGKIGKQEVIKKIRIFYAKDRGKTTLLELIDLFDKNSL